MSLSRKEIIIGAVAVLFAVSAQSADRASLEAAFEKVRAVADDICTVMSVQLLSKADPTGKDPLVLWRAEAKDSVTVTRNAQRKWFSLLTHCQIDDD